MAGLIVLALAAVLDAALGVPVTYVLRPVGAQAREARRAIRDPRDDPAEIYGTPVPGGTERVLCWKDARLVRPVEAPARALFLLPDPGDRPWSVRRLWVAALSLAALALVAALVLWRASARRPSARA